MNLIPIAVLTVLKLKRIGRREENTFLTRKLFRHAKFVSQ